MLQFYNHIALLNTQVETGKRSPPSDVLENSIDDKTKLQQTISTNNCTFVPFLCTFIDASSIIQMSCRYSSSLFLNFPRAEHTNYREMVNTFSCCTLLVVDLENGQNSNAFSSALFRKFGLVYFGLLWFTLVLCAEFCVWLIWRMATI